MITQMATQNCAVGSSFIHAYLTPNEFAWLEFLQLIANDEIPCPTLRHVQALRKYVFSSGHAD